jgi:hypothetical protein
MADDDGGEWTDSSESGAEELQSGPGSGPGIGVRDGDYLDTRTNTWVGGPENAPRPSPAIGSRDLHQEHVRKMQRNVLYGIGGLILVVFVTIVATVSAKFLSEAFAGTLLQSVMAPLLAAAAVVVGYFFGQQSK